MTMAPTLDAADVAVCTARPRRWWRSGGLTALIAMLARASNQIALLGVTLVATRTLGPADFGVFAIAAAFLTLARTMLYTGPFEYVLKAPEPDAARLASAGLVANLVVAALWLAVLLAGAACTPLVFRAAGVGLVLAWLAPSNLGAALAGWQEAMVLRAGAVRLYYAVTIAVEGLGAAVAVALLLAGWGLLGLVAQIYVRLALFVVAYGALLWRVSCLIERPRLADVNAVLRWSFSRYGSVVVGFLANYSGDLLLGAVFTPAATGLYRAGNRVVSALADMFVQPAGLLVTTELARENARTGAAVSRASADWLAIAALFAALCWPALAVLALLADGLAPLLLGRAWVAAGPVIAVFCAARLASLPTTAGAAVLVVADRQHRVLLIQAVSAIGTAALTLLAALHPAIWATKAATAHVVRVDPVHAVALAAAIAALATAAAFAREALRVQPGTAAQRRAAAALVLSPTLAATLAVASARWMLASSGLGMGAPAAWPILALCAAAGMAGWIAGLAPVWRSAAHALALLGHSGNASARALAPDCDG